MDEFTAPIWSSIALVTIDMQRDTLDGQPLAVAGTSEVVPRVAALASAFRAADRPIVHVVRLYTPGGENADLVRRRTLAAGNSFLEPGTDGVQLAPGILPAPLELDARRLLAGGAQLAGPREWIIFKPRWGAFFQTSLEVLLHGEAVTTIAVAGCNFPNCPRTTVYEASERDFRVVLAEDAVSGVYDRGLAELRGIGVDIVSTAEIVARVGAGAVSD